MCVLAGSTLYPPMTDKEPYPVIFITDCRGSASDLKPITILAPDNKTIMGAASVIISTPRATLQIQYNPDKQDYDDPVCIAAKKFSTGKC